MKLLKLHILLAGILLLTGCSKDDSFSSTENVKGRRVTIQVGMPDDQQSRVSYDPDETKPAFTWEAGDQIILIGYDDKETYKGQEIFSIQEGETQQSATFVGYLVNEATQYHVYYKSRQLSIDNQGTATIDYSSQTQAADKSAVHIKDYLLLQTTAKVPEATLLAKTAAKGNTTPESGSTPVPVRLKMQNSIMKFNIEGISPQVGTLQTITWQTNIGATDGSSKSQALALNIDVTNQPNVTAFMCFDPSKMGLTQSKYMHITFAGTTGTHVASGQSTKGMTYVAGKRYYINIKNTIDPQSDALRWIPQQTADEIWMRTEGDVAISMDGYTASTKDVDGTKYQVLKSATALKQLSPFYDVSNSSLSLKNGDKVTEVILPDEITTIHENAFRGFIKLNTIKIPTSLSAIGNYVFENCPQLTTFTETAGGTHVKNNGKILLAGSAFIRCVPTYAGDLAELPITSIREAAFKDCKQLTGIILPADVKDIPTSAFENCPLLATVDLSHVTNLGESAFKGCTALSSITSLNAVKTIEADAFKGCQGLNGVINLSTLTQTMIKAGTFYGCNQLTQVTLPATVTTLEGETDEAQTSNGAFQGCSALTTIDLSNVTTFGANVFERCSQLSAITSIEKAVSIGKEAFKGTALTSVTLPTSVTTIGSNAFNTCHQLTKVLVLLPYKENIDMTLFANNVKETADLYINRDWTITAPTEKQPKNKIWGSNTWKTIYLVNADGKTGIEKLPDYEDLPLN